MNQQYDLSEIEQWVKSVGGIMEATQVIMDKIGCSKSKAEKIAGLRYKYSIPPLEEKALAELIGKPREVLFPISRSRAS